MQLQVPHHSLAYADLMHAVSKDGFAKLGTWMYARLSAQSPDEVAVWFRSRLLAVLNADGEVHIDTHHTRQGGACRFYDALLTDNGFDEHFYIGHGGGFVNLMAANRYVIGRHVRIAIFRPDRPVEWFA